MFVLGLVCEEFCLAYPDIVFKEYKINTSLVKNRKKLLSFINNSLIPLKKEYFLSIVFFHLIDDIRFNLSTGTLTSLLWKQQVFYEHKCHLNQ